jgi:hypothetical protein
MCNECATEGIWKLCKSLKRMAGTTRLELATSAVTEHLDLEFQALVVREGTQKHIEKRKGTLNVPALFPDSSVGIPKPSVGRIGTGVLWERK